MTITDWTTLYYADDIDYTVRVHKGGVVYKKSTGTIRTVANAFTAMSIAQRDTVVYKNTPHKYDIAFTSATAIRDGTSIQVDFTNLTLATGDQFFCTLDKTAPLDSNSLPDIDGIGCSQGVSSSQLLITNLGAVAAGQVFNLVVNLISDKADNGIQFTATSIINS